MKKSFKFAVLFFVLITIWKWLSTSEIQWIENIILTIGITLVSAFIDWTSKPYEYKKKSGYFAVCQLFCILLYRGL